MAPPRIAVTGAGALGCYFGGRLAQAGVPVTLIGRPVHVEAIRKNGLLFESGGKTVTIRLDATTEPDGVTDATLVLFCVKSADTEAAASAIAPHLSRDAVILSLQNGVGNVERIRAITRRPVVAGIVYTGANMPGPGHVQHTSGGRIVIGAVKDCGATDAQLAAIVALFAPAGVTVAISPDVEAELWTKLMMNSACNAACALVGKPYGEMMAMPEMRALMTETAQEVIALARAKGVKLADDAVEAMFRFVEAAPLTMSSTAQDIAKGRRTEIDYLNGYVAREGAALGVPTPLNRALAALIKLREKRG